MSQLCACGHQLPSVATATVRVGRITTKPTAVCEPTLERMRRVFPAAELTVTPIPMDPWQPLRDAGYTELELRAAAGDR